MLSPRKTQCRRRLLPLAAGIVAFFAIADAGATTFVYNCEDHGQGSLRYAVSVAPDGDVVDLRTLNCSKITLTTGAIQVPQQNLSFYGPGPDQLTITGKYSPEHVEQDRIFNHTGTGTFELQEMTVNYGSISKQNKGGCIYSAGSITIAEATVNNCFISNKLGRGGAIFATNTLQLFFSTISSNGIDAPAPADARGGGVYSVGDLLVSESTIDGNLIGGAGCSYRNCIGGGAASFGNVHVYYSTISNNSASFGGGMFAIHPYAGSNVSIYQSTISGNKSTEAVAGIYINAQTINFVASTIAFNIAHVSFQGTAYYAAGLSVGSSELPISVALTNMLISNNAYNFAIESDFGALQMQPVSISGNNDFIRESLSSVPIGTISGACPSLGTLRDNGGPTKTIALLSHSPAIDAGKNVSTLKYDQRVYSFSRVSGTSEDIGAYEVQQGDVVFNDSFNPCG